MSNTDYYSVLEVVPTASQRDVKAAYRRLARLHHPDQSSAASATLVMQQINEAYAVLSNPKKRNEYDQSRISSLSPNPVQNSPSPVNQPAPVVEKSRETTRQPETINPAILKARQISRQRRLLFQLKVIFWLVILALGVFVVALFTGAIDWIAILVMVFIPVYIVGMLLFRLVKYNL